MSEQKIYKSWRQLEPILHKLKMTDFDIKYLKGLLKNLNALDVYADSDGASLAWNISFDARPSLEDGHKLEDRIMELIIKKAASGDDITGMANCFTVWKNKPLKDANNYVVHRIRYHV